MTSRPALATLRRAIALLPAGAGEWFRSFGRLGDHAVADAAAMLVWFLESVAGKAVLAAFEAIAHGCHNRAIALL